MLFKWFLELTIEVSEKIKEEETMKSIKNKLTKKEIELLKLKV